MNGCLLERLVLISLNPVKALPHHVSPPFSGSFSATSTNLTFYQQHELFSIIHNEMLLCLSWPLDLVSHLDAARLREQYQRAFLQWTFTDWSFSLLRKSLFFWWRRSCAFFFFFSDGVNTFDLEPTNSAPTKTRLMLSPSFLAITDRSLTPSLSSNTWCFPLCNALVIALQTLQYISYFRVNELPENFQVDMKFWCGVRPCCTSVKFWSF